MKLTVSGLLMLALLLTDASDAMPVQPVIAVGGEAAVSTRIDLPAPRTRSEISVEQALHERRSVRAYAPAPLTLAELAQLLWAAQGITDQEGRRTAPSAGALYPLELYAVVDNVTGLASGVYRYLPRGHRLERVGALARVDLLAAAWGQEAVAAAPVVIVIAGVYARTAVKYGKRAVRYMDMEAGHVAQNLYLQAVALELGTVVMGAFDDAAVRRALGLPEDQQPLYLMPVGRVP